MINSFDLRFNYIPIYKHIFFALKIYWIRGLVSAGGALATILVATEFIFIDWKPNLSAIIVLALLTSVAILVIANSYYHHIPSGFENEPRKIQLIAHFKREKWETKLARGLLDDRLSKIELKINDIINEREYVALSSMLEVEDYVNWLHLRHKNLLRMLAVAKNLLLNDSISSMVSGENEMPDPLEILQSADRVKRLYESTHQFGINGKSVLPPEGAERLHEIQETWVNSIQKALLQLNEFLESVLNTDAKKINSLEYSFIFDEPSNVDEYTEELRRFLHGP